MIDDPRVVPWYRKAIETNSYDRKFYALDRLCRLQGDEALAGIVRGVATKPGDFSDVTKPELAAVLVNNIRMKAAHGLARSPHPRAKSLLLALANDESESVRLFVVQTAAKNVDTRSQKGRPPRSPR